MTRCQTFRSSRRVSWRSFSTWGRPLILEASGETQVSISHSGETTLAVAAAGAIGCDLEAASDSSRRSDIETADSLEDWCMTEALRKIGCRPTAISTWATEAAEAANQRDRVCHFGDHDVMCRRWGAEWIFAIALSSGHAGSQSERYEVGELVDEPG